MARTSDNQDFWARVEHRMKIKHPFYYRFMSWLMRVGMMLVLLTATYLVLGQMLSPAQGYFITSYEMLVHPILWALFGVFFIITGAVLRFRAMGEIIEQFNNDPDL